MSAGVRAVVDPRFPAELARLRRERGMSLRGLARDVFSGKSYLHDLETGRAQPTGDVARHLDDALRAGGTLAAMVVDTPAVATRDDDQRLAYVISRPTRLDASAVRLLSGCRTSPSRVSIDGVARGSRSPSRPQAVERRPMLTDGRWDHRGRGAVAAGTRSGCSIR
ncbi:helix-turn-helix domain-containing protein [Micromonospora echinospora]|uniref:helix-turn-helix domain-containing protein n=1 Tax=Micromonospora echinospora TaxID=1877 RepID=UPI003A8C258D